MMNSNVPPAPPHGRNLPGMRLPFPEVPCVIAKCGLIQWNGTLFCKAHAEIGRLASERGGKVSSFTHEELEVMHAMFAHRIANALNKHNHIDYTDALRMVAQHDAVTVELAKGRTRGLVVEVVDEMEALRP